MNLIRDANELGAEVARQTSQKITEQLNAFIESGAIVLEYGPFSFVRDIDSDKITFRQTVELKLKDQEIINSLKEENKSLREQIDRLRRGLND